MTPAPHIPPTTVTLRQPPHISFGTGCALECTAELTARNARRILVVLSASARKAAAPVLDALRAQSFELILREGVPPEPTVGDLEKLQAAIAHESIDAVVGIGGGSVLDVAKLLAALHGQPDSVRTYFGMHLLPPRRLPLLCLPTTAGAGSEVSPNAILYDEEARLKKAVISQWLVPDAAFVDPQLTVTLPPAVTAATGIDALSHCLEAYANRAAHPAVDLYALEGIRLLSTNLEKAVRNGADLDARSACALGSLYGGLCLGPVNTAAVHALSYPLGSEFRLAHGLANALLLPHVVRFNIPADPARYAKIALALGVAAGPDDHATALAGVERLAALAKACGLPAGLSAVGVPVDAIPRMATDALKITRLLKNNPRELTLADAEQIYRDAFKMSSVTKHRGVIVPMATPFTETYELDQSAAEKLVERLASHDLGVFVLGTTGEAASIPTAMRRRLVEITVKVAAGRVPVYAGVGDNCVLASIEQGQSWLKAGVDGVVAVLPSYYVLDASEMQACFELLADKLNGPLVLYNIPQTTRMSVPLEVVEKLSARSNVVAFKDSENAPGRLERTAELFGGRSDFSIFMGAAVLSAKALRAGFHGLVPSSGNVAPAIWRDLYRAALEKNWTRCDELQIQADTVARIYQRDRSLGQSLAAMKICLEASGIGGPTVLPPLRAIEPAAREAIRRELAAQSPALA